MKKLKVLIADDEEMIQDLYEMIIESEYACVTVKVANGVEAIAALESANDFDLIISDYNMPKSKGSDIYFYNKNHQKLPFFLFSGGDISDYAEFTDFNSSHLNFFFGKPFSDEGLLEAVGKVMASASLKMEINSSHPEEYICVRLSHYVLYATDSANVFLKLSEDKFTKIINNNPENLPDVELLQHYLKKGVEHIYLKREFFYSFIKNIFEIFQKQITNEDKNISIVSIAGFNFNVSVEGLNEVGINEGLIEKVNEVIEQTIDTLFNSPKSKENFIKLCDKGGMLVGHSMLIMYIAGRLCKETNLNFIMTMKKICGAAFYHDLSLIDQEVLLEDSKNSTNLNSDQLKVLHGHPANSAMCLPDNYEVVEDTKKIIIEHHELPNGNGYPRHLDASQIAPLSCLFILAQEITYCLIRNNFSHERLRDFLENSSKDYNQGNFTKFYTAAEIAFK